VEDNQPKISVIVTSIAYLLIVSVLGYAAIMGEEKALVALIAIVSPTSGSAVITFLKNKTQ
jgi:hypothetical protein